MNPVKRLAVACALLAPSLTVAGLAPAAGAATARAGEQAAVASVAGSHPVPGRETLGGSLVSPKARRHPVGVVATSSGVSFELVLKLRDPAGAAALVRAVSTPGSSSYRHYLTTAQWEARFSPGAAEVRAARNWLRSAGFGVGAVSADRITVAARGTAAQVEKAFATRLARFKLNGHVVRLATRPLSVPAPVAGIVVGALGINQYVATPAVSGTAGTPAVSGTAGTPAVAGTAGAGAVRSPGATNFPPPPPAFLTAPPCGSYYGEKVAAVSPPFGHGYPRMVPDVVCGYKPAQLRTAYYLKPGDTGKGTTVAVVDAYGSATIARDAARYFRQNDPGLPFAAHFSQDDAFPFNDQAFCGASGWLVEQATDVEAVYAMAPGAHVLYVGAKNCQEGLFTADQKVIDHKLADVITNSWGDTDGDLFNDAAFRTAFDDELMLAGSTGITVLFSTGDAGDNFALTGISAADYPAVSPYATGVGGTSLQIGANGRQAGQLGWATGLALKCTKVVEQFTPLECNAATLNTWLPALYTGGSGGFTSYTYAQPAYQANVVPQSLALRNEVITGPVPMRVVPDISMDADPSTGFLIGLREVFPDGTVAYGQFRIGGTSLAAPLLAGVVADADQAAKAAGQPDVGFINPAIYAMHASPGAIDDILPGGNQAVLRVDHASSLDPLLTGLVHSFWELTYEGPITYCDETGNCVTRDNTLSTAQGYDSMTGLGSIGPDFIPDLAK